MLRTYFFIPASKSRFIDKMNSIDADEFVFDFEDAIAESEVESAFENIKKLEDASKHWVRPRLFNKNGQINNKQLEVLFDLGFTRFVLPKISTEQELHDIYNIFVYYEVKDPQWILLLESPLALCNIPSLFTGQEYPIKGISLGAQDYAAEVGMCFSNERILWARNLVLNAAHAYGFEPIDIASMTIQDIQGFENETIEGFKMGYTAKIVLHPSQLKVIKNLKYFSDIEIDHALRIAEQIDFSKLNEFSVITVDGQLYEKPHLSRIRRIIEYVENRNISLEQNPF
ncbi:MAG: aldolase/citrate lyase family protein [Salinivirgaceae bacterium]|nr:aldolase/citrate lyase family protein [Salinivirgaceae bacterium]MDD4745891.1 aldolase/citrate lyase family protein [Salinivirgaceae bacterium]MDY0278956.1 aldolase/citrate lyase family protein [Salinivirgaceae bacterium]